MRTRILLTVVLFFVSACVWAQEPENAEARALGDKFLSKAESVWKDRIGQLLRYSGEMRFSMQSMLQKSETAEPPRRYYRLTWDVDFPNAVFESGESDTPEGAETISSVVGRNKDYMFHLQKETADGQWTLESSAAIDKLATNGALWKYLMGASPESYGDFVTTILSEFVLPDNQTTVMALLLSPYCVVEKYEKIENDALRIYFKIEDGADENKDGGNMCPFFFKSGTIDLAPKDGRVLAAVLENGKFQETMTCEYEKIGSFNALVAKNMKKTFGDGRTCSDDYVFERSNKSFEKERFTLSNYGLPEPNFETKHSSWSRGVCVIVGLALIALAAARLYRRRREKANA